MSEESVQELAARARRLARESERFILEARERRDAIRRQFHLQ